MKIINKLNIKVLFTVYLLLNFLNLHRIAHMAGFTLMCGQSMGESTIINNILFYACVAYGIIIHFALIVSIILVHYGKHKPFFIVSIIDFVVYALMVISTQFIIPYSVIILIFHLLIFLFVFNVYNKKNSDEPVVVDLQ